MTILMAIGSPDFTGGPRMAMVMARALKFAGHRVIVVSGPRPPIGEGSVLDVLRSDGIETIEEVGFECKFPDRRLVRRISAIVHQEHVKCLISEQQQDFKVMPLVARQTCVKLVYHAQNAARFSGNAIVRAIKRSLYRQLLLRATAKLICVSDAVRVQHVNDFGVPTSQVAVVDNGVDLSRFGPITPRQRLTIRAELGVAADELLLLNVGRLSRQKGQDLLLRALASANLEGRPFKLVIVGAATYGYSDDAAYVETLHRLADAPALAGRVVFAGWRDDIPAILRSADIYLHSANWEGMPLAVLEAMAAGLPCLSTDCAGVPTGFIPGCHGYIVQTGNEMAFKEAIEKLVGLSADERDQIGRAAEELVARNFDVEKSAERFVSLIEQVINDQSNVKGWRQS